MIDTASLWLAAAALLVVVSVVTAGHALLNKRDPRSALGWVAFILFSPVVGIFAYLVLGINRIRRRARRMRHGVEFVPSSEYSASNSELVLRSDLIDGNFVECLLTNEEIFASARTVIRSASRRIFFSVYIFEAHGIGQEFIEELGAAVTRGVSVHVLLDGVGALYSLGRTRKRLASVGVEVGTFLPLMTFPPNWHLNLRNHRKILVVDEEVAIVGGTNIRNGYLKFESQPSIRDMNFLFRGPIVDKISAVFKEDWHVAVEAVFPTLVSDAKDVTHRDIASCRVVTDGPDNDVDILSLTYQAAIGKASRRVRILTPYFLPPPEIIAALQLAAVRGVNVELIFPGVNNIPMVHWATRNMLSQLLRYGVHVFYQEGPFDHSKLLLVDDDYCLIGSANLDARSLRLNFEIGVEVESQEVSRKLNAHVDLCVDTAREVSRSEITGRSFLIRLRDAFAWLFTPYL